MSHYCSCYVQKTIARSLTIIVRECVLCRAYHYYSIDLEGREVNIDTPDPPDGDVPAGNSGGAAPSPGKKMPSSRLSEFDPS